MPISRCRSITLLVVCIGVFTGATRADFQPPAQRPDATVTNIILFIGDGMGRTQVRAASLFATGKDDGLSFHRLPQHATVVTDSVSSGPTDSAASATALATGVKVNNGVVSMRMPGDMGDLPTIAEQMQRRGAAVGLVTTDSILGATPAAFFSHAPTRGTWKKIAADYTQRVKPDVILGAGYPGLKPAQFTDAGYTVVSNHAEFDAAAKKIDAARRPAALCGLFPGDRFSYCYHDESTDTKRYGTDYPSLVEMTGVAIDALDKRADGAGFFLVVESALVDKSGHSERVDEASIDRIHCNVRETVRLSEAVEAAVRWADQAGGRTLIIVTADHETGGLAIVEPGGKGEVSRVTWQHKTHTRANVDVWANAWAKGRFEGEIDNTQIYRVMADLAGVAQGAGDAGGAAKSAAGDAATLENAVQ